jgi:hypothetical protein
VHRSSGVNAGANGINQLALTVLRLASAIWDQGEPRFLAFLVCRAGSQTGASKLGGPDGAGDDESHYVGSTALKAMLRCVGTIGGALLGVWLVGTYASSPVLFLLLIFIILGIAVYKFGQFRLARRLMHTTSSD